MLLVGPWAKLSYLSYISREDHFKVLYYRMACRLVAVNCTEETIGFLLRSHSPSIFGKTEAHWRATSNLYRFSIKSFAELIVR